jgi:hypothetical protein
MILVERFQSPEPPVFPAKKAIRTEEPGLNQPQLKATQTFKESPMYVVREPVLHPVSVEDLRPTQITVGMREVDEKRHRWRELPEKERVGFLGRHMIPAVCGPKEHFYIIDHHHLARALYEEGAEKLFVIVVSDLKGLDQDTFWTFLDHHGWVYPYDAKGRRRDYADLPKTVSKLKDDPFRSMAGELRRAGGFAKDTTPFSEFLWADFLRRQLKLTMLEKDFDGALKKAMKLAKGPEAKYLPGWCGPSAG